MKFRPLHDRVVIRRIEGEEKTKGGIIIPDTAKEKPQEGEVIAVGPGAREESGKLLPLELKAGDRVLFGKWSGTRHPAHNAADGGARGPPTAAPETAPTPAPLNLSPVVEQAARLSAAKPAKTKLRKDIDILQLPLAQRRATRKCS